MPIIGKLIKKTAELSYKRIRRKGKDFEHQVATLNKLLEKAKDTRFGKKYGFESCLDSEDRIEAFQHRVPITEYNDFYEHWLQDCIAGKRDVIWPGRIRHYALSSGTTGSPSKRIPVTVQMIRSFQKSSIKQLTSLHEMDLPENFFTAHVLAVGGSTQLTEKETHIEGDLSGILKKYTSKVAAPFAKPPQKITKLKNWNEKLELMVQKAPEWNIGIIAGVPSWCIMLMEKIIHRYQLESIHDIWPNLRVYVHGGVFMDPYKERLERLFKKEVFTLDTYLASEGYFAYQVSPFQEGMELLLNNGVFFEFVPFNSEYFNEEGTLRDHYEAFTLDEIQENEDYAIVISTNAGLWRYMVGDLVRLVDKTRDAIVITGRIKQFLSLVGEHLSLENINMAITQTAVKLGIQISEFGIYPDGENLKHRWYIGVDKAVDSVVLMKEIDACLGRLNDDYASARKYSLNDPELIVVSTSKFYDWLELRGKLGAQNKFPRVMNTEQKEAWIKFITGS